MDVFSAGVLMYSLLSGGIPPFYHEEYDKMINLNFIAKIDYSILHWLKLEDWTIQLVKGCLERNPLKRFTAH